MSGPGDTQTYDANGVLAAVFDKSLNALRIDTSGITSGAPADASYLTAVSETALSNEKVFGAVVFYPPDIVANRPSAAATIVGAMFYATDSQVLYRSDGVSVWQSCSSAGGSDKLGLTPTAVKTANYTAAAGDFVPCDLATTGSFAITFPTAPADGTVLACKIIATSAGRSLALTLGGSDVFNVAGGSASGSLSLLNQAALFQYKASSAIWYTIATDIPLSQSDARYLQVTNNLSDVVAATARTNLGLGGAAVLADPITAAHGGLGTTTLTAHGVVIGNGTGTANVAATGTSGQVLTSNGASSDPTMQNVDISSIANGALVTLLARGFLK